MHSTKINLAQLDLDATNPRFGGVAAETDQAEVLRHIVETFGIEDLISSISENGYFDAEPLVVKAVGDRFTVVEGNRRLAACLVLTGDSRTRLVRDLVEKVKTSLTKGEVDALNELPAIVFPSGNDESLVSYLGVKHIAGAKSWDSYAKAAWVNDVTTRFGLSVEDVSRMIGDRHATIQRLLEGYRFVTALTDHREFFPTQSIRPGRGSVTAYPFSWIYTALGYSGTRDYLKLDEAETLDEWMNNPALRRKGGNLLRAMFGDRSEGRSSVIQDSRQIGQLSKHLSVPSTAALVESGKPISEIEDETRPIDEFLNDGVIRCKSTLSAMLARMVGNEDPMDDSFVEQFSQTGRQVLSLMRALIDGANKKEGHE